jgi:hypothetical protein
MSRWRASTSAVISMCGSLVALGCSGVGLLADWQVVRSWSGRDTREVQAFEVGAGAWRLTYTMHATGRTPGLLRLQVAREDGSSLSVTGSTGDRGSGTLFGTGPGRFRVTITASRAEGSVTLAEPR